MPKLTVTLPDGQQIPRDLSDDKITIGRADDNRIQIEDTSLSSHHAELISAGDGYRLKDLDSTNGTKVNEKPITETALTNDDVVTFGQIECIYEGDESSEKRDLPSSELEAQSTADKSAAPADFENVAPFAKKAVKRDPVGNAIKGFAWLCILVFIAAMVLTYLLHAPQ